MFPFSNDLYSKALSDLHIDDLLEPEGYDVLPGLIHYTFNRFFINLVLIVFTFCQSFVHLVFVLSSNHPSLCLS